MDKFKALKIIKINGDFPEDEKPYWIRSTSFENINVGDILKSNAFIYRYKVLEITEMTEKEWDKL